MSEAIGAPPGRSKRLPFPAPHAKIMDMKFFRAAVFALAFLSSTYAAERWTPEQANSWYAKQPWLIGSNYLPAYASNELEMWQAETFDPKRIDLELGWAQNLGMTTMRVFLHDLLWKQDPDGFKKRIDTFLSICQKHHIRPLFVLFDSCWDPDPKLGPQPAPRPGIHNSRWVQSPGAKALDDPGEYPRLEAYVKGVVGAFASDDRVLGWDIWNEPDNHNNSSYGPQDPKDKTERVLKLLPQAFAWARAANPSQPLTSGVWHDVPAAPGAEIPPMAKEQLDLSDIVSFHNYDPPAKFDSEVVWLDRYHRPVICTEYMARPQGSTFQGILPVAKKDHVGAINWGFVAGKSQTYLPWDSWQHPYTDRQPPVWFHDIFRENGTPYRPAEVQFIKQIDGATKQ
ncbi:MAG TPA: cellulase family glycosylhydrolase [Bryobacteraceae bacterium]|jgi:hypothetical protein|nr:cellulase family glycosylhydrolase [Bryobacteraceae bacterium]